MSERHATVLLDQYRNAPPSATARRVTCVPRSRDTVHVRRKSQLKPAGPSTCPGPTTFTCTGTGVVIGPSLLHAIGSVHRKSAVVSMFTCTVPTHVLLLLIRPHVPLQPLKLYPPFAVALRWTTDP